MCSPRRIQEAIGQQIRAWRDEMPIGEREQQASKAAGEPGDGRGARTIDAPRGRHAAAGKWAVASR